MQHNNQFHPTTNKDRMLMTYSVRLEQHEAQILRPLGSKLLVDLQKVCTPLDLFGSDGSKLSAGSQLGLTFALLGNPNSSDESQPVLELGSALPYTTFDVKDFRLVYAFVNLLACTVENAFIVQAPMTPQQGFQRTWSTYIDVPKGLFDVEYNRRTITIARGKPKMW